LIKIEFERMDEKIMEYQLVKIRTVFTEDDIESGLSFLEAEQDIPFKINRLYCVYERENKQKGFHLHKHSWQLLFCPYGVIDVLIDDGEKRKVVSLDTPSKGLILHPGVWREITWKVKDSVLCVATSGHYEPERLRTDYNMYLDFIRDRKLDNQIDTSKFYGEGK
jgi:dTDP-4-dehydrorhamnose 3,5-epimerase-like enzyme